MSIVLLSNLFFDCSVESFALKPIIFDCIIKTQIYLHTDVSAKWNRAQGSMGIPRLSLRRMPGEIHFAPPRGYRLAMYVMFNFGQEIKTYNNIHAAFLLHDWNTLGNMDGRRNVGIFWFIADYNIIYAATIHAYFGNALRRKGVNSKRNIDDTNTYCIITHQIMCRNVNKHFYNTCVNRPPLISRISEWSWTRHMKWVGSTTEVGGVKVTTTMWLRPWTVYL